MAKRNNNVHTILLISSLTLWMYSVGTFRLGELHLEYTPFMMLTPLFWVGFTLSNIVFFRCDNTKLKYAALIMLSFYSIVTLVIIEPYGRMHDSIVNIYNSQLVVSGNFDVAYNGNYPAFYLLIGMLIDVININPWTFSRIFPLLFLAIYIPFLFALFRNIAEKIYVVELIPLCTSLFLYYMLIFVPTIWIRMNPAPQTFAYLLSILLLVLLFKKNIIYFIILFLIVYLVLLISHPLTPLLSIPGFIAILYLNNINISENKWFNDIISCVNCFKSTIIITIIVIYFSWILYVANGIFSHAIRLLNEVSTSEAGITGVTQNARDATLYSNINNIYLFVLLLLLFALYLKNIHDTNGKMVTIWFLMVFPYIIMLGPRFISRGILFLSISAGIIFSSLPKLLTGMNEKKIPTYLVIFLICLSGVGIYRSQYIDNALDRPTLSEIRAQEFAALNIKKIVATSFYIPLDEFGQELVYQRVGLDRHLTNTRKLNMANAVIISQQMIHYSSTKEGKYEKSKLYRIEYHLNNDTNKVYDNDFNKVFIY